jgi:signal transduction histidine kinase
LAFVREIARLHGGRCLIANHPGGGAVARLEFALAPPSVHTESTDDR